MSNKRLSKKDRKKAREYRRKRQNKRNPRAGEYSTGKTDDRKEQEYGRTN